MIISLKCDRNLNCASKATYQKRNVKKCTNSFTIKLSLSFYIHSFMTITTYLISFPSDNESWHLFICTIMLSNSFQLSTNLEATLPDLVI